MCVLAFAWRAHPRWQWVLAGNRDELHARPASALHRWPEAPHVLAGKDLQSGGTWLGVSEQGRFAVVTNLSGYGPPLAGRPSRGDLVKDFLLDEGRFAALTQADAAAFNPFNLILATPERATLWRNRPRVEARDLTAGVHGLSNGDADRPWPKTLRLMDAMTNWLGGTSPPQVLLDRLGDDVPPPGAAAMTERGARTGVFVHNGLYGTRCSTVAALDAQGRGVMVERRFDAEGGRTGETELAFDWPG
jgi:uncharacterized protein with NRDE domain